MGSFAHYGQDDSQINKTSAVILVSQLKRGLQIGSALGYRNSAAGGNTGAPETPIEYKPLPVLSADALTQAISFSGAAPGMPPSAILSIFKGLSRLSDAQIASIDRMGQAEQLKILAGCGYKKDIENIEHPVNVDARTNAIYQRIFQITGGSTPTADNVRQASIIMNVLSGVSGPGVIEVGDSDRHRGVPGPQDEKDLEIGTLIGRAVEAAHQEKRELVIEILTDGGMYADAGTRNWRGDSGLKCMTVVGHYNPNGASKLRRTQVGAYTDDQVVSREEWIGAESSKAAYATLANYLYLAKRTDLLESGAARSMLPREQVDRVLLFG
jgi:hypothetical protein